MEVAGRRVRVIAGAGSNSTSQAIELTRRTAAAGADAALSMVPYYNKPMQAGIHAHFQAIAVSADLPIILHDIPSRTVRVLVCGIKADHWTERRDRRRVTLLPPEVAPAGGISTAVRRRRDGAGLFRHGRRWLYFDGFEYCAGSLPGDLFELQARPAAVRQVPASSAGPADRFSWQGKPWPR